MVFISYRRDPDYPIALLLKKYLEKSGITCFLDEGMDLGTKWLQKLRTEIRMCDYVLLILSKEAQESTYVHVEIEHAHEYGKTIIPLKVSNFDQVSDPLSIYINNSQIKMISSETLEALIGILKKGEQIVSYQLAKEPPRALKVVRDISFVDMIEEEIETGKNADHNNTGQYFDLKETFFAMGVDVNPMIKRFDKDGIAYRFFNKLASWSDRSIESLQMLIDQAIEEQLLKKEEPLEYGDCFVVHFPITNKQTIHTIFAANSSNISGDMTVVDSRRIIISIFDKCNEIGEEGLFKPKNLVLGAIGTGKKGVTPMDVATTEVLNCFGNALKHNSWPYNLFYTIRAVDIENHKLSIDEISSYMSMIASIYARL